MINAAKIRSLTLVKNTSINDEYSRFFKLYMNCLEEAVLKSATSGSYWCHFAMSFTSNNFKSPKYNDKISKILDNICLSIEEELSCNGFHNNKTEWNSRSKDSGTVNFITDVKWIEWLD